MEKIEFTTEDGVKIVGDWYPVDNPRAFALLLHMMPTTKEIWRAFATELNARNIAALAIDERGHGESTNNGLLDYHDFSNEDQQNKILDFRAAHDWLMEKGATLSNSVIVGGSIGANLAIQLMAERVMIKVAVAMSPGLDYHGVLTGPFMTALGPTEKILLVASDDDEYSFQSVKELHQVNERQTELNLKSGLGHATNMFDNDPGLIKEVVDWIENNL